MGVCVKGNIDKTELTTKIIVLEFAIYDNNRIYLYDKHRRFIVMENQTTTPTAAELEILNILWDKEPLTVKDVHEKLAQTKDVGYTTTLKIMQNMTSKGLVVREPNGKNHLYRSARLKEETRGKLLDRFLESTFAGSATSLVMQLLGNKKTSARELDEIKRLIDQMEQNQQP